MQHFNRSRPKHCATVPAGKTDPMGARVMYSVKAPAGAACGMRASSARPCLRTACLSGAVCAAGYLELQGPRDGV